MSKAVNNLKRRIPPPPTWPKNPRQDSFGNPTTKKPGDTGTAVYFDHSRGTKYPGHPWRDLDGQLGKKGKQKPTRDFNTR